MSFRTKIFKLMPWNGGTNTSLDPSIIPSHQLTKAEHLLFGINAARNMRDGINFNWDSSTANSGSNGETILGLCDFWYGSSGVKTNFLMGVGSSGNLYQWNKQSGLRTTIPLASSSAGSSATPWPQFNNRISFEVMNNMLIFTGDQGGNFPRQYAPFLSSSAFDLQGSPPRMSFMREFMGRLWTNDKTLLDRANYCPPGDPNTWGGIGDSGAIDIGVGDGDPVGLSAIFPAFQNTLYIAKQTKLYSITGYTPETYQINTISDGIGCVSHNAAVAIDHDDIIFLSEKGVHSLIGTIQFGDVESKYLSKDIQGTINTSWTKSALANAWGCYLSQINSVAFCVPDTNYAGTGNTAIWLYNLTHQAWYVWPTIDCQSIVSSYDTDKRRFYLGTTTGRVAKTFNNTNYDISIAGVNAVITMTVKTGFIFPEENPMIVNAIKRFTLIWGPSGTVNVTATIQIDNYTPQALNFAVTGTNNVLGVNFILGSSPLGFKSVTEPYSQTIDGYGRSFQVTLIQSGQQAAVNIQGIAVEYEPLGPAQETITSG